MQDARRWIKTGSPSSVLASIQCPASRITPAAVSFFAPEEMEPRTLGALAEEK
jgi:hypothetical protein